MLAANGIRGRLAETNRALRDYLRTDPQVGIAKICCFYPFREDAHRQRMITGLRKAGVPE